MLGADDFVDVPHIAPPASWAEARDMFNGFVMPLVAGMGAACELIETYSVARCCEIVRDDNQTYLIYDHAQLDCFLLLDWLDQPSSTISFVAAALHRVVAEACRMGQEAGLYCFFMRRALEIAPLLREHHNDIPIIYRRWQALLVLLHEAGHAIPKGHSVREAIDFQAQLMASTMMNEMIAGLSGYLNDFLGDDDLSKAARDDYNEWEILRDDIGIGTEAIAATLEAVATDRRFLNEVASDCFAIWGIQTALTDQTDALLAQERNSFIREGLLSASRGLLHLRLLSYVDAVAAQIPLHLDEVHINPLKLKFMVEIGFRANIVVLEILQVAAELCGQDFSASLRAELTIQRKHHSERLLSAASALLEETLTSKTFHAGLTGLLAADGVSPTQFETGCLEAFVDADELWISIARRSFPSTL